MPIFSKFGLNLKSSRKNIKYKNRSNLKKKKSDNKENQLFGIIILATFSYVLLCLIFRIIDRPASLGEIGATISEKVLNFSFGYPTVMVIWLFIVLGWKLLTNRYEKLITINFLYSFLLTLWLSYLFGFIKILKSDVVESSMHIFGITGMYIAKGSVRLIGDIGSVIMLASSLLAILLLWLNIDVGKLIAKIPESFEYLIQKIKKKFLQSKERKEKKKRFKEIKDKLSPLEEKEPVKDIEKEISEMQPETKKEPPKIIKDEQTDFEYEEESQAKKEDEQIEIGEIVEEKLLEEDVLRDSIKKYEFPQIDFLEPEKSMEDMSEDELIENAKILEKKLMDFGVEAKVVQVNPGPVITMYDVIPAKGVKISRIVSLADDLALAMKAKGIRIVAPIPGKGVVGIEIPNKNRALVRLRSIIKTDKFKNSESKLSLALGKSISGEVNVADLSKMPHLLIAGATGSGKSVALNAFIASILFKSLPNEVKFILIDPKKLELANFSKLKHHHLLRFDGIDEEVITTPANTVAVLGAVVSEMEERYNILAKAGVRNIREYNRKIKSGWKPKSVGISSDSEIFYIIVVIDELADLMLMAAKEVEEPIARLAQMARAVGIHLVVATQRPSVDVITGVIKANFPARIAFNVASKIDSRTILDMNGAETLLGEGDMLFLPPGSSKANRIQCPYVSTEEIDKIINHIAAQPKFPSIVFEAEMSGTTSGDDGIDDGERDPLFHEAMKVVIRHQQGSTSLLQRRLRIGYARAARIMDELEAAGIVGKPDGSKARDVLYDESYLDELED